MILGVDIGGSATKLVVADVRGICGTARVPSGLKLDDLRDAAAELLSRSGERLETLECVALTGVGASGIEGDLFGAPTCRVEEFVAISLGGQTLSGLERAIIVSAGTGTAYIRAEGTNYTHLGGSGLGGGTLVGLSKALLGVESSLDAARLALGGDLARVDLRMSDICTQSSERLPEYATASSFGKLTEEAGREDLAAGLFNLVLQNIGVMAYLARGVESDLPVVVVGAVATLPQARIIFDQVGELYQVRFVVPDRAEFATAVGAVEYVRRHGAGA